MAEKTIRVMDGYDDQVSMANSLRGQVANLARSIHDAMATDNKIDAGDVVRIMPTISSIGFTLLSLIGRMKTKEEREKFLFTLENGQLMLLE